MGRWPSLIGPSYIAESPLMLYERSVNLFTATIEVEGGKNRAALIGIPGVDRKFTATDAPGRGAYATSDGTRGFAIMGRRLQEVDLDTMTLTDRGTMAVNDDPAQAVDNGTAGGQLAVCSGGNVYVLTLATNAWSAPVKTGISQIDYLNGVVIGLNPTTSALWVSNLNDAATWAGDQFFIRSAAPDPWRAFVVHGNNVVLIGEKTGDIHYPAGTVFPFLPVQGVRIPYGIKAPFTLRDMASGPVWIANNKAGQGIAVQLRGQSAEPVSSNALSTLWQTYGRIDDAIGWTYEINGRETYIVDFPTPGKTWAWDPTLGVAGWHERAFWDRDLALYRSWRPRWHMHHGGKHIVLDSSGNGIYAMDPAVYTDVDGNGYRKMRVAPGPVTELRPMFLNSLKLDIEAGVGLQGAAGDPGVDPQISLRASPDGGGKWSYERLRSMGKAGKRDQIPAWTCIGGEQFTKPLLEFVCSDPVRFCLNDAYIEASLGLS